MALDKLTKPHVRRSDEAGGKDNKVKQSKAEKPGWASGLRQLYDSVVEEPLPDTFNDLIAKLDRKN